MRELVTKELSLLTGLQQRNGVNKFEQSFAMFKKLSRMRPDFMAQGGSVHLTHKPSRRTQRSEDSVYRAQQFDVARV